ncbi:MAG TPA: ATP-dependent DNA helicase [Candidatus Nanopelagicales bacterium]|nr:ATP-dependent DNA helicase [Candidatus Nanopelagicales bacterium]
MPAPELDPQQRAVVDHREGPLLVLAGPGTGKTTTIVESVVSRLEESGASEATGQVLAPDSILVMTFGRRAAEELRDRIAARRGGGALPQVATFHSFAYGLVRSSANAEEYSDPPRLLSGAEEDQRIRELIRGTLEDGSVPWPADISEALHTHGFAVEVRTLIARMRERDLSPARLRALSAEVGRPEWAAIADIAEQEQDVMVLENVLDYTELMRRAVICANDPHIQAQMHGRLRAIYVDEFQDTDPLQVELLRAIAGPHCSVVAVGDPDQSIYAFRGADVRGICQFPERFAQADGTPAPIIAVRSVRRFGPTIAAAAQAALAPALLQGLPVQVQREHRAPHVLGEDRVDAVHVLSCGSRASRNAHIAEQIRAAHIHQGIAWSDMAVLVRTFDDLTGIQRALHLAGVPAAVTADEIPLRSEPAVAHLLAVLDIAADTSRARVEQVLDLLTGPIGRLDSADLRRLGRALRDARRGIDAPLLPARDLIGALVVGDEPWPVDIDPTSTLGAGVQRVTQLIVDVAAQIATGAAIAEVLWTAWTGGRRPHGWPERMRESALAGSLVADHDLDAVIALFDTAERISERYQGVYGVAAFVATLRDQAIPAESIAAAGHHGGKDLVPIMTVHRAKGLEWPHVWVAGLEEGSWPNVRPRGSLLGVQELEDVLDRESGGSADPVAELVREERNLLYVACTRARERLTVLCIDSGETGDERPSRFIADLAQAGFVPQTLHEQPQVIAHWSDLVADLRVALQDPLTPDQVRGEAATLLAHLSTLHDAHGQALVPAADPDRWWGVRELSRGPSPLREAGAPIALSGSSLDALRECSMKWFLDHEVHAETVRTSSTAFGSIVHAIADHVAKGTIAEDIEAMDAWVDQVWSTVEFEAAWRSESERLQARRSLERFLRYHVERVRELVDTERYLEARINVPVPGGTAAEVTLRGYLDRVERDDQGRLVAVDLKTTASVPTKAETAEHGQLGVYQLLLREAYRSSDSAPLGGAALVQLRKDAGVRDPGPKEQFQSPLTDADGSTWIETALGEAVHILRSEDITAQVGKQCTYCAFSALCPAKNSQVSVVDLDGEAQSR